MNDKLPKIKCAILDDDIELKSKISKLLFIGGEKLKIELDGVEFKFPNTFDQDWSSEVIKDYSIKHKIDFWIVDSRAIDDDGEDTNYSFRVINSLENLKQKHCVFTSDPSFKKRGQYSCKVFKKDASIDPAKAKDAETPFHGGLLEMALFIKDQVGWGEFATYVRFLDYTTNNYHDQLKETMREISNSLVKVEDSIDSPNFEKESFSHLVKHTRLFIEVLCLEFKELSIIPYLEGLYDDKAQPNPTNCINFLIKPDSLNAKKDRNYTFKEWVKFKEGETKTKGVFYEIKKDNNGLYKFIDKSTDKEFAKLNIGKNMKSTLIGASLQFIYAFDNTNLHFSDNKLEFHSVKSFLEAFKFICLRLNILFPAIDELLPPDNNAENSVNEEVADDSTAEEVTEETPTNEETPEEVVEESKAEETTEAPAEEVTEEPKADEIPEAAIEENEDVIRNIEDEKEDKIPSYRNKNINLNIIKKIDLDNL